ncbi:hypothetical protein [Flavobacterium sp. M31R6]|uniref:hypothetical protein n=1 Tax=Flavobacterium sp. M31R6 TaxID=2739062 RepID=UPI001568D56F|nr:hypothetical protein [Flavobacterium sp. M31R6]QKJ62290.1 hypothetical protein HQN62_03775 [Flavobacterium sp. M31R6]
MQPSAVERLDFEKHQTGASIGSIHWRKCNLLQWSDWILKSIKLEHPLALFIGTNATFCSGATGF